MTVNSRVIKTFLAWSPDAVDVPLMNGLRVQILPTIDDIPRARKHQFAAFIASEALLVVWDDDPSHLLERAKSIEGELMQLVWQTGEAAEEDDSNNEKKTARVTEFEVDEESGEIIPEKRSTNLMNTILVAFTLVLVVVMLGLGFRAVAIETVVDKNYLRMAFILLTPVQVFFTLVRILYLGHNQADSRSSLPKSSLVVSHNVLDLYDKCSSIRNTTQPNARLVYKVEIYHT